MSEDSAKDAKERLSEITKAMNAYGSSNTALVERAFDFAITAHKDHFRNSGEPYINHLLETARVLAELGSGGETVAAGILHDSIEDVGVSREQIEKEFGADVAFMVEGVTKLGKLRYKGVDRHNESLRKLFVAMSEDIRVLIIKLADRLHNMRTLKYVPQEKQGRIAAETLEIYAPIAYRLGIRKLSRELEDLAFPYVYPKEYEEMKKALKEKNLGSGESLERFSRSVRKELAKEGYTKVSVEYRVKGLFSLYKKFLRKGRDMDKIYDINAMRILADSVADCYRILGIVHSKWRPLPHLIKDYIAFPKPNGYQSIHTTVFVGDGNIVEIQIKTAEMHARAEYGIASHFSYKAGNKYKDVLTWIHSLIPHAKAENGNKNSEVPKWIKDLAEYDDELPHDHKLFRERLTSDFFNHRIFVFSPNGDVVDLPIDATPIDFAYHIHSDIGNTMAGAKVNGKMASLEDPLKNGDIVEIITRDEARPNRKWIDMAKTSMARRHIKTALARLENRKR